MKQLELYQLMPGGRQSASCGESIQLSAVPVPVPHIQARTWIPHAPMIPHAISKSTRCCPAGNGRRNPSTRPTSTSVANAKACLTEHWCLSLLKDGPYVLFWSQAARHLFFRALSLAIAGPGTTARLKLKLHHCHAIHTPIPSTPSLHPSSYPRTVVAAPVMQ